MDAFENHDGEKLPAATLIIMKNKQQYTVQGAFADVLTRLNSKDET